MGAPSIEYLTLKVLGWMWVQEWGWEWVRKGSWKIRIWKDHKR